jgi:hypothetical protein
MKTFSIMIKVLVCILCIASFFMCKNPAVNNIAPYAAGTLTITYKLNPCLDSMIDVTWARVVWLEDANGKYVKTLSITEWVSTTGWQPQYTENALPHWNKNANWGSTPKAEVDAVTKATSQIGPNYGVNTVITQVTDLKIKPGTYTCCVEVNVTDNYNIMLKAQIKIGNIADQAAGTTPVYTPGQHPTAGDIVSNLTANFAP